MQTGRDPEQWITQHRVFLHGHVSIRSRHVLSIHNLDPVDICLFKVFLLFLKTSQVVGSEPNKFLEIVHILDKGDELK